MYIFILKMSFEFIVLFTILWVFFDTIYQYCLIPHYRRKIKRLKPSSFFGTYTTLSPIFLPSGLKIKSPMNLKSMVLCFFPGNKVLAKLWL